jgi:hypothetical protein
MKKRLLAVLLASSFGLGLNAQNGVAINTDNSNPDNSAILDVKSTDKGMLIPRMTDAQKTAIATPATGLLVFQTDGTSGFYYYNGTAWELLSDGDGIYGGDGTTPAGTDVSVTDYINFDANTLYLDAANNRIGMGTTIPDAKLTIGTPGTTWTDYGITSDSRIGVVNGAGGRRTAIMMHDGTAAIFTGFEYGPNTVMPVALNPSGGNVGIGTNAPAFKLDMPGGTDNARLGGAEVGAWPANSDYAYFGHQALDHSAAGNYALLQQSTGTTFLNAAAGTPIYFRIGNASQMIINSAGNIGMGTTTPNNKLEVAAGEGDGIRIGIPNDNMGLDGGSTSIFFYGYRDVTPNVISAKISAVRTNACCGYLSQGSELAFFTTGTNLTANADNSTERLRIASNGNVGIGTATPTRARLEVIGSANTFLNYGWLNSTGGTGAASGTNAYSIYANQRIAATEFNAFSDERIKDVIGRSNTKEDLATLSQIQITDYAFIDKTNDGFGQEKKVIAQELKEVYPIAVDDDQVRFIPDVMQYASLENQWIELKDHKLNKADKVRLIFEDTAEEVEVLEVKGNKFKVASEKEGKLLVYGREVNDFHTVDYDALVTLNISASQEMLKRIEALEKQNAALEQKLNQVDQLKAEIEEIKTLLNSSANK